MLRFKHLDKVVYYEIITLQMFVKKIKFYKIHEIKSHLNISYPNKEKKENISNHLEHIY